MAELQNADPHKDPIGWVKRWIEREIGDETTFKIPDIANKLTDVILADKTFLAAYVRKTLRDQVYLPRSPLRLTLTWQPAPDLARLASDTPLPRRDIPIHPAPRPARPQSGPARLA